jgi:hypothetical protein
MFLLVKQLLISLTFVARPKEQTNSQSGFPVAHSRRDSSTSRKIGGFQTVDLSLLLQFHPIAASLERPVSSVTHLYPRLRMPANVSQDAKRRCLLPQLLEPAWLPAQSQRTPCSELNPGRIHTISIAESSDPEAKYTPS